MCASFIHDNVWIWTTDRDLESQRHEKENAWIRARQTSDRDFESQSGYQERDREREKWKSANLRLSFFFLRIDELCKKSSLKHDYLQKLISNCFTVTTRIMFDEMVLLTQTACSAALINL